MPFGILPSEDVRAGDHIAYFWETDSEFEQGVKFLSTGLLGGRDHGVVFGHDDANRRVCEILERQGASVRALRRQGRLTLVGPAATGDKTLAKLGTVFKKAIAGGAPLIRLLGNIGWNKPGWPGEDDTLLFEAKVTGAARQFPAVIVCMYDVRSLPGRIVVHGGFGTHPIAVCGNVMRVNPFHQQKFDEFAARVPDTADARRRPRRLARTPAARPKDVRRRR